MEHSVRTTEILFRTLSTLIIVYFEYLEYDKREGVGLK